jgi:hypothetical protein
MKSLTNPVKNTNQYAAFFTQEEFGLSASLAGRASIVCFFDLDKQRTAWVGQPGSTVFAAKVTVAGSWVIGVRRSR